MVKVRLYPKRRVQDQVIQQRDQRYRRGLWTNLLILSSLKTGAKSVFVSLRWIFLGRGEKRLRMNLIVSWRSLERFVQRWVSKGLPRPYLGRTCSLARPAHPN